MSHNHETDSQRPIGSMGFRQKLSIVGITTVIEAVVLMAWIMLVSDTGSVYAMEAVGAGFILFSGLVIEDLLIVKSLSGSWQVTHSLGLAVTEVVVWTQWAIIVTTGMWAAHGIGPAYVVLAVLLVLQHSAEHSLVGGLPPFDVQIIVGSIIEAIAATVMWVFILEGALVLAGLGLAILLGIEHSIRVFQN